MQLELLNVNKDHFLEVSMDIKVAVKEVLRVGFGLFTPIPVCATVHTHTQSEVVKLTPI
jgi:hypothetical protein